MIQVVELEQHGENEVPQTAFADVRLLGGDERGIKDLTWCVWVCSWIEMYQVITLVEICLDSRIHDTLLIPLIQQIPVPYFLECMLSHLFLS